MNPQRPCRPDRRSPRVQAGPSLATPGNRRSSGRVGTALVTLIAAFGAAGTLGVAPPVSGPRQPQARPRPR
ncbi:hypothetical protein [Streptacidiphilus sp. P02-A3a]|uniref:hypothetical protein n=1 Tax=Streptacidiphilus sp. P02-A3a TaxID=2704468 RepID=UPI0015FBE61F|nr:hypothetical protein [Streptacidiphilus sp. P02-A3a]QMU71474.1 hypothetical protein GXP74_27810 [Streptacidiphilus sp. P02-A3a]